MVKTRAKILAIFIDALYLFACSQKPLYTVLGKPKPCAKKTPKDIGHPLPCQKNKTDLFVVLFFMFCLWHLFCPCRPQEEGG